MEVEVVECVGVGLVCELCDRVVGERDVDSRCVQLWLVDVGLQLLRVMCVDEVEYVVHCCQLWREVA